MVLTATVMMIVNCCTVGLTKSVVSLQSGSSGFVNRGEWNCLGHSPHRYSQDPDLSSRLNCLGRHETVHSRNDKVNLLA